MIEVNINQIVYAKLTNAGRQIHKSHYDKMLGAYKSYVYESYRPKEDKEGFSKFHLWDLMRIFGPYLYDGCLLPFESDFIIKGKDL